MTLDVSEERASSGHEERRDGHRVNLQAEVTFDSDSQLYTGLTQDLSSGGLFIATYHEVSLHTEVMLEVQLPTGPVSVRGVVRWKRSATDEFPPGLGISFVDISKDALSALVAFSESREPLLFDDD